MHLTRRSFLVNGLRVTAAVPILPRLALGSTQRPDEDDRVLVVLQLTGGNDGLSSVVPFSQDVYYRLRPNLGLARGAVHRLDDDHGLNPQMRGLAELFEEGRVAIVHGIGSPNPDRSHFRSLEIWHTADPDGPAGDVGWLGRMADEIARRSPNATPALAIDSDLPLSMRGEHFLAPTIRDPRGFRLNEESAAIATWRARLIAPDATGDLAFLRSAARTTYHAAERMTEITALSGASDYPGHDLAQKLQLVASLVAGGFGTRVFHLSLGGFDTHARQAPVHASLMLQLSESLTAFQRDLESKGVDDRVVTLVFSEFGRRVAENASKGTDHGRGAPAFLLGTPVRGGLHGTPPDLERLIDGDIRQTTDFRAVYAMLETTWMGLPPSTRVDALDLISV